MSFVEYGHIQCRFRSDIQDMSDGYSQNYQNRDRKAMR